MADVAPTLKVSVRTFKRRICLLNLLGKLAPRWLVRRLWPRLRQIPVASLRVGRRGCWTTVRVMDVLAAPEEDE